MGSSFVWKVRFAFLFVTACSGFSDQKVLREYSACDIRSAGLASNWWWATFSNVGDRHSCPTEPLSAADERARVRRVPMIFERPLETIPTVHVSVTKLKTKNSQNMKYRAQAVGISNEGFTLEFRVFCDTYVDEVELQFLAIG
eukprot:g3673.t1